MTNAVEQLDYASIENIYLSVSDESIDDASVRLTEQAIDDAEERAEELAKSLDFRIERIISIEVVPSPSSQYGDEVFYRGVRIVEPYYYNENVTGEISVSVTGEFQLVEDDDDEG